jgi:chitinase
MYLSSILNIILLLISSAFASLNLNQTNNLAVYWGQNSGSQTGPNAQGPLLQYCDDPDVNIILLAFLTATNTKKNDPELNFANQQAGCDESTQPLICPYIGGNVTECQEKGKTVLLSIGGQSTLNETGFKNEQEAQAGAAKIWAMFGPPQGDSSSIRPLDNAIVDGFDLDFEKQDIRGKHLDAFSKQLRSLTANANINDRQFYLSAAPECSGLSPALADIHFDMWFTQFYSSGNCDVRGYGGQKPPNPTFAEWNTWAANNKTKMFVGLAAHGTAALSGGYIPPESLSNFLKNTADLSNMAGVSLWDATQAFVNNNYHKAVKAALNGAKPSS